MRESLNIYCGISHTSHRLDELCRQVDVLEISTSFNELLKPERTVMWARKSAVNPGFTFTVKLNRRFTHERVLDAGSIRVFKEGLWPLMRAGKLGCVLMQFPWSFRYTVENRAYLISLRRAFHEFPLAAEMRHASWMFDEAVGTFIDYRIAFCNIDQPAYIKAMPPTSFLTSSIGYVRLHGRNCFNWFGAAEHPSRTPRYDYTYTNQELAEWARRIDHVRGYASKTFVIANNGEQGQALTAAFGLRSMLNGDLHPSRRDATQAALFTEFHPRAVA